MTAPLLDIEEADAPDLGWHCDAKDKDPRSEEQRQAAFLSQARILCPGVDIFAVPNGGKRSQWAAMKAKREGMRAGICDLVITWPGRGIAWLEFKNGTSMPDANQREFLNRKVREGHDAGVFRQAVSALRWLKELGAPFIGDFR